MGKTSSELSTGGVRFDITEGLDLTNTLIFLVLATEEGSSSFVWVVGLEHEWVLLDVFEGVVHKTSIAALVNMVAVDELLLGEGLEFVGGEEHGALNGTGGGESPAGSALSLVLDWGDGTLGSPVDGVGEVGGV